MPLTNVFYAVTVTLNYEEIKKDPKRITKIKPFMKKYNYPSEKDDWKTFDKNDVTIALNFLYAKKEKIYSACFKASLKLWKTSYSFNGFTQRQKALSCSHKTISIIEKNNF